MRRRGISWITLAALLLPALAHAQQLGAADLRILGGLSVQLQVVDDTGTPLDERIGDGVPSVPSWRVRRVMRNAARTEVVTKPVGEGTRN